MSTKEICPLCGVPVKVVGKTTQHYEPLEVGEERLKKVFDKFREVQTLSGGTVGAMMNMQLRDKIIQDLRKEFIILRREA